MTFVVPVDGELEGDNGEVTYGVDGGVAWLQINRPEARNALSQTVRTGLWSGLKRFNDDEDAKVLILTAAGDKAFCAGGDLKEMANNALTIPPPDFLPYPGRNITVDKPLIAAVNGVAYTGGFLLAQLCDLVLAADTATFAITEAKVGRGTPWAAPLPRLIPPRVAMELLLTGAPISATRAYEVGLVNQVVPLAELHQSALDIANVIVANAPLSVRAAKALVHTVAELPEQAAWDEGDRLFESVYLSADAQEGPQAFREKRAPNWKGR